MLYIVTEFLSVTSTDNIPQRGINMLCIGTERISVTSIE